MTTADRMGSPQAKPRPNIAVFLIWPPLVAAITLPIAVAATSPLLAWRDPVYVMAGFAGIIGMGLLLVQPLLVGGYLPGFYGQRGRRIHRWVGCGLLLAIVAHVAGLWITSPPDVIDALLFRSPTPFSAWGVVAMWAVFLAALLAALRRRFRIKAGVWRFAHSSLALVVVAGSVVHAVQIDGTMGMVSKVMLCTLALAATVWTIYYRRSWVFLRR